MSSTSAPDDASRSTGSSRRLKRWMVLLLWAPVAWIAYFWVVYLVTEAACVDQPVGSFMGDAALTAFVIVATVVSVGGVLGLLLWAGSGQRSVTTERSLRITVVLLVGCFTLAVLAVGIPALVLDPC